MSENNRIIGSEGLEQGGPALAKDISRRDLAIQNAGNALTAPSVMTGKINEDIAVPDDDELDLEDDSLLADDELVEEDEDDIIDDDDTALIPDGEEDEDEEEEDKNL